MENVYVVLEIENIDFRVTKEIIGIFGTREKAQKLLDENDLFPLIIEVWEIE